ncbi:hypothetical protein A6E15_07675 [Natrinema saccharevitans]|uniref:Uncharacterized protein n=1 Tax=Natrinema saccharevitans TaxID=301967 RepID=A0A1S8AWB6_9EURY|nr:hypothetical protein [Natrinema saccharevitans]OLZ40876.1 hypothetical protein A6E15_07675 [Natrinema saccharevitans]
MTDLSTRRSFLALAGTGAAASLAGCSQLDSMTQSDNSEGDAVTVTVAPNQEDIASLNEEYQSGNLTRQEAVAKQRELIEQAGSEFEDSASDRDFTIEDSETQYGLFRVTGSDGAIMESLRDGPVDGIYPGDQYEVFIQQRRQQQAMREQQQEAGNETTSSDGGNETDSGNETEG